MIYYLHNTTNT